MALGLDLPPGAGTVGYRMMCPILSYPELGQVGGVRVCAQNFDWTWRNFTAHLWLEEGGSGLECKMSVADFDFLGQNPA